LNKHRRRQRQQEDDNGKKGNLDQFHGQLECLYGPPTSGLLTLARATLPLAGANIRSGHGCGSLIIGSQSRACSHVLRQRPCASRRTNPALKATFARQKHRNEMVEQLVIMLLPMPRRRATTGGQWRGAAHGDANHCSRRIRIAKIEPKNCSNRAREKMKRCVIGACTEGMRQIRREQQPRADAQRLHTVEVWPHSRRAARHQSPWRRPCMDEGWWRKRDWSTMGPTGWWRGRGGGGRQFDALEIDRDCRSSRLDNLEYRK
jgi:hypothetical protein